MTDTLTSLDALHVPAGAFSVLSFNLLAPCFVRVPGQPWNAFSYCRDEDLDWPARQQRIVALLLEADADVVCLQEVQLEERSGVWQVPEWLTAAPLGERYTATPQPFTPKRANNIAERNLSFVGSRAVTAVVTLVRADWQMRNPAGGSRSLTLVVEHPVLGALSLTNVHLEGNPERVEAQQQQLRSAMKRAAAPKLTQRVLIGDFNGDITPSSSLGAVLTATADQFPWRRVSSGQTLASPGAGASVDHALYGPALEPMFVTDLMTPALVASGLPAPQWPSDHLPLAVVFQRAADHSAPV